MYDDICNLEAVYSVLATVEWHILGVQLPVNI